MSRFHASMLAGLIGLSGGPSGASAAASQTVQSFAAPFSYGGVLVPRPKHSPASHGVRWAATPTRIQVVGAMPSDVASAGRTLWSCAIQGDGHLGDCQLKASWPTAEGFGRAARSLIPFFQLSNETVGAASLHNSRVVFEIDVFSDLMSVKAIPGQCPAVFCARGAR